MKSWAWFSIAGILLLALIGMVIYVVQQPTAEPPPEPEAEAEAGPDVEAEALVNETETNVTKEPVDPCETVTCGENELCVDGNCFCNTGFKECGELCIPSDDCCLDEDCGDRKYCKDGECFQMEFCGILETWDSVNQSCVCSAQGKLCGEKGFCIPKDHCCDIPECNPTGGRDRRCTPTRLQVELCAKLPGGTHCQNTEKDKRAAFNIMEDVYHIYVTKIYEDEGIDAIVQKVKENATIEHLLPKTNVTVGAFDIIVSNEELVISGGKCKSA